MIVVGSNTSSMRFIVILLAVLILQGGCASSKKQTAWNKPPDQETMSVCQQEALVAQRLFMLNISPPPLSSSLQMRVVRRINLDGEIEHCSGDSCVLSISNQDANIIERQLELTNGTKNTSLFLGGKIKSCSYGRCSVELNESMESYAQRSYAAMGQNIGDAYADAGAKIANAIRRGLAEREAVEYAENRYMRCLNLAGFHRITIEKPADYLKVTGADFTLIDVKAVAKKDYVDLINEAILIGSCDPVLAASIGKLTNDALQIFLSATSDESKGVTSWTNGSTSTDEQFDNYVAYLQQKETFREVNKERVRQDRKNCTQIEPKKIKSVPEQSETEVIHEKIKTKLPDSMSACRSNAREAEVAARDAPGGSEKAANKVYVSMLATCFGLK